MLQLKKKKRKQNENKTDVHNNNGDHYIIAFGQELKNYSMCIMLIIGQLDVKSSLTVVTVVNDVTNNCYKYNIPNG